MSLSSDALLRLRPGRRRNKHRGKVSHRESELVVKAVVLAQRARTVGDRDADNPMAGYCLGRLRLRSSAWMDDPISISQKQFDTGERYARLAARHAAIMGYATGSPRSPILDMIANGLSCRAEPDEDMILEIRRDWSDAYRILMDTGRAVHRGIYVALATYDCCLDRLPFETLDEVRIGDLRVGLNALHRMWRHA